jgi:hypothetical protein
LFAQFPDESSAPPGGPLRLLVISFDDLPSTTRLVAPAAQAGFEVAALSASGGLVQTAGRLAARFPLVYDEIRRGRLQPTYDAINRFRPDFVLAGDTLSARLLNFLARDPATRLSLEARAAVRRSASSETGATLAGARWRIQELARSLGIPCAASAPVAGPAEALAFVEQQGFPVYLKTDYTFSGLGVRRCDSRAELEAAFDGSAGDAWLKRLLLRGHDLLVRWRGRGLPLAAPSEACGTMIEAAAPGEPAFHVAVALEGRWLAGFSVEVEEFYPRPSGPSSRIRILHDADMAQTAQRLIRRLGHSGL